MRTRPAELEDADLTAPLAEGWRVAMYRLRWKLDDIASATAVLRADHHRTDEAQRACAALASHLDGLSSSRPAAPRT